MAKKRLFNEVDKLDDLSKPICNATLHGVVASVSPLKKGRTCNYFEGFITDGSSKLRVVGFNPGQQKTIKQFMDTKETLQLTDCEVKQARRGNSMEILLKGNTEIKESPKKFKLSKLDLDDETPSNIKLADLDSRSVYDRVSVTVKVLKCSDPVHVSNDKKKQDITIADLSAVSKITLWQENIGKVQTGMSYNLDNFMVREYASTKFLTYLRHCEVKLCGADSDKEETTLSDALIVAVLQLDSYKSCLRCKARVEPESPPLGRCSKPDCTMLQRYDVCSEHISAKLLFKDSRDMHTLYGYGDMVKNLSGITDSTALTEDSLLRIPKCSTLTHNENNVITDFQK